ncbi:MAG: hypothetical protein L6R39_006056 [Caloplaca ligustica]|nr:MAG: hypothetical protein L6R39_006056 [Caloplaca ligustica]
MSDQQTRNPAKEGRIAKRARKTTGAVIMGAMTEAGDHDHDREREREYNGIETERGGGSAADQERGPRAATRMEIEAARGSEGERDGGMGIRGIGNVAYE